MASITGGNLDVLIIIIAFVIVTTTIGLLEERRINKRRDRERQTLATTRTAESFKSNWGREFDAAWPDEED